MASGVLGLPPYVVTFLRHMESYKDFLKWNIGESSHKVTLTISWNFQKDNKTGASSANILDKLHKTLSISHIGQGDAIVPPDVSAFIDKVPKKHKRTRLKQRITTTIGAIKNTLSMSQTSIDGAESFSYNQAPMLNHSNHIQRKAKPPLMRNNSFHGYVSHSTPKALSLPYSPTRSTECSWPAASETETCYSGEDISMAGSADLLCYPGNFIYAGQRSPTHGSRGLLPYRSTPDIDQSLPEDFMDNTCADRQRVRNEADKKVMDWSKIVTGRITRPNYFKRGLPSNAVAKNSIPVPPPPLQATGSSYTLPVGTKNPFAPSSKTSFAPPIKNTFAPPAAPTNSFQTCGGRHAFQPPTNSTTQLSGHFNSSQPPKNNTFQPLDRPDRPTNSYEAPPVTSSNRFTPPITSIKTFAFACAHSHVGKVKEQQAAGGGPGWPGGVPGGAGGMGGGTQGTPTRKGTVVKCLDSCDKILARYETEIT